ncbi:proprotein convertase subtilisin/kexin type 5 [Osmerus eperlanus]|uniref:proprotein convertase subtilisin/kexin type 5 n=1 Tax=Osmerus eperlanus TaxID=29151 RepID=UPI002E1499DF
MVLLWLGSVLPQCLGVVYTNDWAVRITGGPETAESTLNKYGFVNMGQVGDLEEYYWFRHNGTQERSMVSNKDITRIISKETKVEWLQQQVIHSRTRRNSRASHIYSIDVRTKLDHHNQRSPNQTQTQTQDRGQSQNQAQTQAQAQTFTFNDPQWSSQWYLHCDDSSQSCPSSMNIEGAWRRGFTGRGVVVTVLDDGIDPRHPDLQTNYDPLASYDITENNPDPTPRYDITNTTNNHGTACAGIIAATANNSHCIVGVSFHARIGGIRMLDGDVTDIVEAQSLSFRPQHVDIYSASWGPEDDGRTVEGPGTLARLALEHAIRSGRKGRGSIFMWASGNGGRYGDHCSCDGYASSIYTISVSSSTRDGGQHAPLEPCASTLTTAYGAEEDQFLETATLDLKQGCTTVHSGSSVSTAMAAGVIALALDANPVLTWRDVQHLIVRTSQPGHLDDPDWYTNAAGYKVSHQYGFGLLDAERLVKEAESWRQVPPQHVCEETPMLNNSVIPEGSVLRSVHESTGCSSHPPHHVVYVEHVLVRVTVTHGRRGDLSIALTSPAGTRSQLLANRPLDQSTEGFRSWEFMTTHCWGERSSGKWSLEVLDMPSPKRENSIQGKLEEWALVFYGTSKHPYSMRREQARSAELPAGGSSSDDLSEEYSGPCDAECGEDGCEGPAPQQCVTCLHFFLKFKNNTRTCVSACPVGFWGDRHRCKKCYSSCESCNGSRSDQCTSCRPGHHLTEGTNSCTAKCGDNYYLDHDLNTCRRCSDSCLRCTSVNICTECKPGTSLQGNRCQRSCGAGSYLSDKEGEGASCQPCDQACATCAGGGAEACNQCAEGYLMEEWRCVFSCSPGFYATLATDDAGGQRMCRRCDAGCLTCVGPGSRNCSSCASGRPLQDGMCVVSTACGHGEYQDSHGACHACEATCMKCTGPKSEDCISCEPSWSLDEGRCEEECSQGKYQSGGQCHLCDHTCATCLESGPANCTSCDTDKFGTDRYLYSGECVDTCPEAFYHTQDNACAPCPAHCTVCSAPSRCLRCNSSYYVSNGFCSKLECGEGEVEDPEYDDCMACEEGCKKCVLYNPRHCLSCTDGFYKFQEGCYKNCPAKTYIVPEEMTCVPCDDNCVSCDEDQCYWCETDLFLSEGKCVPECPDGFYGDEDTQDCEECHPDCATCTGPDSDSCLSCEDEEKRAEDGECVPIQEACPEKTFYSDEGECEDCHASCSSCSGELKSQCVTCVKGRFLTAERTCVSRCPAGHFSNRTSGVCEACSPGCASCVGAQRCTRCQAARKTPFYLQDGLCVHQCLRGYPVGQVCHSCVPGCGSCEQNATHCVSCDAPLVLHQHQCVESCPPGHSLREGACQHCPLSCLHCDTQGQCTDCEEYHFLQEGHCVADCPEGFFEDSERRACERCHPDCELCDGARSDDCDACADPAATLLKGACLSHCPAHTYRNGRTGECEGCGLTCLTCSGPGLDACLSCKEGLKLDTQGHCAPLTSHCPPHHYQDQPSTDCHPCHKHCHQCYGPGKTHCFNCNQNHFLLNETCLDKCPVGYFQEEAGLRCEACHPSCQSCVGKHSHECLNCQPQLYRDSKDCVDTCQASYYGNAASRMCERCDPSCSECFGGAADECLSCAHRLLYLRKEGRCLSTCPQGHYRDSQHLTCEPCHPSCRSCSGVDPQVCESCDPGYSLSDGLCESQCSLGEYSIVQGEGHSCEDCHSSCLECRGPGLYNCTMCPSQAILASGGRCLLCCRKDGPTEEVEEEEGEGAGALADQQECCNCTETRGECVLSTNFAFRNEAEEESTGNLALFITTSILLLLGLAAVVLLVRRSRSKSPAPDIAPRGYEKLGSGGGGGGRQGGGLGSASSYGGHSSAGAGNFGESQLAGLGERGKAGAKDEDDDDEDEDIVYMGQDGTVYRKFRYGGIDDDQEDELEYDDESYTFR